MIRSTLKNKILQTFTLVFSIVFIGVVLTACQTPVKVNKISLESDSGFAYPTKQPSVAEGKKLFEKNCSECHNQAFSLEYINKTMPSEIFKLITNSPSHKSFKDKLSIKERWDTVMYLRYQVFGLPDDFKDIQTKFGANCAVCHGTRGHADGSLHYFLNPPPANFTQFSRLYERSDEKIFDEIKHGISWTAMPPWGGRVDKDSNYEFDDAFIWQLVKYVRHFGYSTESDILREEKYFGKENEQKDVSVPGDKPSPTETPGAEGQ